MTRGFWWAAYFAWTGLLLRTCAAAGDTFEIVRDGKPVCAIVIAAQPTPSARLAALELQYHFLEATGAEVPVRTDDVAVEGPSILVGDSAAAARLGFHGADLPPQEYLIALRPAALVLLGRDWRDTPENRRAEGRPMTGESLDALRQKLDYWKAVGRPERSKGEIELPGLYDDQGSCLAAYDFLERHCGVRWYGPAPLNCVTPRRASLAVSGPDVRRSPALKHRSALPGGNWPFLRGQWGEFSQDQVRLYWRRIRQGGERWAANHTFYRATIQAAFQDPEYQSRNPATKGSQLCYSNPRLVEKVVGMARDYFDGKGTLPEGWKAAGDYFAVVPDDDMNLCNCPACTAGMAAGRSRGTGFFSGGKMSDYWFSFVNEVAREVRKTHPGKYIATLGYWEYATPPSFPLEPNVSVAPCLHTCYYAAHEGMKANDDALYQGWLAKAKAPMFLWVYYHHPMEPALIDRWKCFPNVMVHSTAASMRGFIRDGVRGIFECGEQDQLEQYVMARVWDDPAVDVDAVVDEFFRLYFGPAGAAMKRFYLGLEAAACDPGNYTPPYGRKNGVDWKNAAWETLGTGPRMAEFGRLMDEAGSLASTDAEKRRVALWRAALWDWMREGREQHFAAGK